MIISPEGIDELNKMSKEQILILYGMGDTGRRIAKWCDTQGIRYLCSDSDENKLLDFNVQDRISPSEIASRFPEANIVVSSIIYSREITKNLLRLGIKKERIIQVAQFMPEKVTWRELEDSGRADWGLMHRRIQMLAEWRWIPDNVKSVADYGAGHMAVKEILPESANYYPIDYINRGEGTIVRDFNKREFPDIYSELSVCIGVLMYIEPAEELVDHICRHTGRRIIVAFTTLEGFSDVVVRRKSGMCQDFTEKQILDMFALRGWMNVDMKHNTTGNSQRTFFLFEMIPEGSYT